MNDYTPEMVGALGDTDAQRLTAMVAINIKLRTRIEELELAAADLRDVRVRVAHVAWQLGSLADSIEAGDMTDQATVEFLRKRVRDLMGERP